MQYQIKVLTDETLAKLNKFLDEVTHDEIGLRKEFSMLQWRGYVTSFWNKPEGRDSMLELLTDLDLVTPQFTTQVVPKAEEGYQSMPRIMWNGKVEKIDDVDQIYSYKRV